MFALAPQSVQAADGTISGQVWQDNNGNAVYDVGIDTLLEGITVELWSVVAFDLGTQQDASVTAEDGSYSFSTASGNYVLRFIKPTGTIFVQAQDDVEGGSSVAGELGAGFTKSIAVAEGEAINGIDAGVFVPAASANPGMTLDWVVPLSSTEIFYPFGGAVNVFDAVSDPAGNVYALGTFLDEVDFDPTAVVNKLDTTYQSAFFLAKYDANGGLVWAEMFGEEAAYDYMGTFLPAGGIAIKGDQIYVAGLAYDEADFDPGPADLVLSWGGFLLTFDVDGNLIWGQNIDTSSVKDLVVDDAGDIYLLTDFSPAIIKFDGDGNFVWEVPLDRDGDEAVYYHSEWLTLEGSTLYATIETNPHANIVVNSVAVDGTFQWQQTLPTVITGSVGARSGRLSGDGLGGVYVPLNLGGSATVDLDPGDGVYDVTVNSTSGAYGSDSLLVHMDSTGAFISALGYRSMDGMVQMETVLQLSSGEILTGGSFSGDVDADPGTGALIYRSLWRDQYGLMTILDASGDFQAASVLVATEWLGNVKTLNPAPDDGLIVSGDLPYFGSMDIDPSDTVADYRGTAFIAKYTLTDPASVGTVSGKVWRDENVNGVYDAGTDTLLSGVTVELWDTSPAKVSETVTDASGDYTFTAVPGDYTVKVIKPAGTMFVTYDAYFDDVAGQANSKIIGATGHTEPISVTVGAIIDTIDAGVFVPHAEADSGLLLDWVLTLESDAPGDGSFDPIQMFGAEVDSAGNTYVSGAFKGTVDFDPDGAGYNLTAASGGQFFIAKYTVDGDFVWAKVFGGGAFDFTEEHYPIGRMGMGANHFYVVGDFFASADFNPVGGTVLSHVSGADAYATKFDLDGNLAWAKAFAGTSGYSELVAVVEDPSGAAYVAGDFEVNIDPGGGSTVPSVGSEQSGVLIKLDANGNYLWSDIIAGTYLGGSLALSMQDHTVVYSGQVSDGVNPPSPILRGYSTEGVVQWESVFETTPEGGINFNNYALDVAASGGLFMGGLFSGNVDFDPGPGVAELTAPNLDGFIVHLDENGDYQWAGQFVGLNTVELWGIADTTFGNVVTSGVFIGSVDIDPGVGTADIPGLYYEPDRYGPWNVFIALLDDTGAYYGGGAIISTEGILNTTSLRLAPGIQNSVVTSGVMVRKGAADFDPGTGVVERSGDAFIAKYTVTEVLPSVPDGTISGKAWRDNNANAIYDAGVDSPMEGVTIELWDNWKTEPAKVGEATTTADGIYSFTNRPGSYSLRFAAVADHVPVDGSSEDMDFDLVNGFTAELFQNPGTGITDIDVGLVSTTTGTISGKVWRDENANALYDAGTDTLLSGITVELWTLVDDEPGVKVTESVTDSNGAYSLSTAPGAYTVIILPPEDHLFVPASEGNDDTVDSDFQLFRFAYTGYFHVPMLTEGASHDDIDAGFFIPQGTTDTDYVLDWSVPLGPSWTFGAAVDASGNSFVVGTFGETMDFDPGPGTTELTPTGGASDYIAKYDPAGALLWVKLMDNFDSELNGPVETDAAGNVYAALTYDAAGTYNIAGQAITLPFAGGEKDAVLISLDASGSLRWVAPFGSAGADSIRSVAISGADVFMAGVHGGVMDADPGAGTVNLPYSVGHDMFVIKLNTDGQYQDAFGLINATSNSADRIVVDATGNVYVAGRVAADTDFDPGPGSVVVNAGTKTAPFLDSFFIAKYDSSFALQWVKTLTGPDGDSYSVTALNVLDDGVVMAGSFEGTLDFDPGAGVQNRSADTSYLNSYVVKLDTDGVYLWDWVPVGDRNMLAAGDVDAVGQVSIAMGFNGLLDLGSGMGVDQLNALAGMVIVTLDANGSPIWIGPFASADNFGVTDLVLTADADMVMTTLQQGPADLDPGTGINLWSGLGSLTRLNSQLLPPMSVDVTISENDFYAALEAQIQANPEGAITFALPDFIPAGMTLTVLMDNGMAVPVAVNMQFDAGILSMMVTPDTTRAELITAINTEVPGLITAALDALIVERTGGIVGTISDFSLNAESIAMTIIEID